jgi:hypothetical protein
MDFELFAKKFMALMNSKVTRAPFKGERTGRYPGNFTELKGNHRFY